ncbi:hypothetical protein V6Z11_A09G197100 [Gossypium hirsutum]
MVAMVSPSTLFLILLFLSIPFSESNLTIDYYKNSCPQLENIIRETVTSKYISVPAAAAGTLRLFFHDCMVGGCDASVLISSNAFNKAERDADINLALPGDAFDVIVRAKTALELSCPGIVSRPCHTQLCRKDSLESNISSVEANIPRANTTMDEIIRMFESKNFTVGEMVALSGAHTIGFSHCKEFAYRLFGYSRSTPTDPSYHPKFSAALKKLCANYKNDSDMAAFNDPMTPSKFDNMFYQNLKRGMGLLESDNGLLRHPRTSHFVDLYAFNQTAFSNDFARAIEKLSLSGIKTGNQGEVRRKCNALNTFQT